MRKRSTAALFAAGIAAGLLLVMLIHATAGPNTVPVEIRVRTEANSIWNGTIELVGDGQTYVARTRYGTVEFNLPAGIFRPYQARLLDLNGNEQWSGRVWVILPTSIERVSATVRLDSRGHPVQIVAILEYRP